MRCGLAASFLLLLCHAVNTPLAACTCSDFQTSCGRLAKADVAFLGTVLAVPHPMAAPPYALSTLSIDHAWKGIPAGKTETKLHTSYRSSCAVELQVGRQYVIFGNRHKLTGEIFTHACSGSFAVSQSTRPWVNALSAAVQSNLGFVHGSLAKSGIWRTAWEESQPLSAVKVTLTSGTRILSAATDAKGEFLIGKIPAGTYNLAAGNAAQPIIFTGGTFQPIVQQITVPTQGCMELIGSPPKEVNFTGSVLDAEGKPVTGAKVLATPIEESTISKFRRFAALTNSQSRFQLPDIPAGDYRLLLQPSKQDNPSNVRSSYYPTTLNASEAKIFHIDAIPTPNQIPFPIEFRALPAPARVSVKFLIPQSSYASLNYSIPLKLDRNPDDLLVNFISVPCANAPSCEIDLPQGEGFGVAKGLPTEQISTRQHTARPGLVIDLRLR